MIHANVSIHKGDSFEVQFMAKIGEFSHEKVSEEENQDRGRIPGGKGRNFKDFFYNITVILICSKHLFKTFVQDVCSRRLFKVLKYLDYKQCS